MSTSNEQGVNVIMKNQSSLSKFVLKSIDIVDSLARKNFDMK